MKNKKNPIVIVDVLLRKSAHKLIIEKAEQISNILNMQNETSSVKMINIKNVFGVMPESYSNISPFTEFRYNISEDSEDIKVIMMTQDRIEYLKKDCTYLGSHYYIKQTEAFERVPFCISTFHLN
ncbi:MAG: hypothetical protein ABIO81_07965 [Ginsengibacter sp.]